MTNNITQQPEALRLADVLDLLAMDMKTPLQAAAELRRLYAENQVMRHLCERACIALQEDEFPSLRQQLRIATKEEDHYV